MIHTAGNWDPKAWPVYFVAGEVFTLEQASSCADYLLVAVNELGARDALDCVVRMTKRGKRVLLDSGVYWLSTQHAQANDITMNEALGLAPHLVNGFDDLYKLYVSIAEKFGNELWGYIEIDQGGRENKIKTRTRLEELGLRPVPVYHPLNDGWDYFDYLAERYDRICFGNVVQAAPEHRKRLIATAWERRRRYPNLWIHVLGVSPNDALASFPLNSCDSSAWLSGVRWGAHLTTVATVNAGRLDNRFLYHMGAHAESDRGHIKARRMCGYDATMTRLTMSAMARSAEDELGADIGMFINVHDDQSEIHGRGIPQVAGRAASQELPLTPPPAPVPRRGRDKRAAQ